MASLQQIEAWVRHGYEDNENCTHVIIVTDTFDYDDYPVYVTRAESVDVRISELRAAGMQQVMEVYNTSLPMEAQLAEHRAWHL